MKVLLRSHIEQDLGRLDQRVKVFVRQLADLMRMEVLDQQGQLTFLRRLLNYDSWRIAGTPQNTQFLDYQVVNSNIEAERDHLRVGDHIVRVLTMKEAIGETRHLVLDQLFKIADNFHVVTEWNPLPASTARKEITKRRRHYNMTKTGFVSQIGNDPAKVDPRDVLRDDSKQQDIDNLGDCLRAIGDGQSLGEFSLTIVVNAPTKGELDHLVGEFAGVFSNADGNVFLETYNQLNALFATVPGNFAQNLRKLYLLNTNYADLSFLFTILAGEKRNPHLDAEYLAVLETDNQTPYFLNLHNGEVPHTLVLGMTGSGKTTTLSAIRHGAEQNGYVVEGFAPTSRATRQQREADVPSDTVQGFLARGSQQRAAEGPSSKHFYMVDESSLASTKQMRDFLAKMGPPDKVLLVGDTRQHQGVDAGKPFEDLQRAGMRTAQLDQIIRQKDPGLLQAVEHLSKNETAAGVALLHEQGRVTEIVDPQQRMEAIAKQYASNPNGTIIISPDNSSRMALNHVVRQELQAAGIVSSTEHSFRVLTPRSDMTGVDRAWAAHYDINDIVYYHRGSNESGLDRHSYARVVESNLKENLLTVETPGGESITYDPARLRGMTAYREVELSFAAGDRLQFTAPNKELGVANRDIGLIEAISKESITIRQRASDKAISFDPKAMAHFDHGCAVTSHSAQGLTTERVLVNIDSNMHPDLINTRLAYVSISRASKDAHIFTNDGRGLAEALSRDVSKASAMPSLRTPENLNQQPIAKETIVTFPENSQTPVVLQKRKPHTASRAFTDRSGPYRLRYTLPSHHPKSFSRI